MPPPPKWSLEFHDWVKLRYGQAFAERMLEGGYCCVTNQLVYYPALDDYQSWTGSYAIKVIHAAQAEGIDASY